MTSQELRHAEAAQTLRTKSKPRIETQIYDRSVQSNDVSVVEAALTQGLHARVLHSAAERDAHCEPKW